MADKVCKVYPRNGLQYIPGILEKRERIEFPAQLPMSEKEIRRCLSYADVYEVTDAGDVLLTLENYLEDNSKATPATDVPEVELLYPRGGAPEEDGEEETEYDKEESEALVETAKAKQAAPVKAPVKQEENQKTQTANVTNNQKNMKYLNTQETKKENTKEENK